MSKTFAHLHNHSEYSLLDGAQTTEAMAKKGAELGLSALSLTDHGRMGGLVEFYSNCKKYGVKPILGMEAYITGIGRSRTDRTDWHKKTKEFIGTPRYERSNYHLILLAKNEQGYDNLCQLSTESYSTGFYQKPRIDYDLLEKYKDGLIVSSACFTAGNRVQIKNNNSSFSYPAMIAIEDVRPGMMVKTHTGSWKRVINRTTRDYNGTGYEIITDHMGIDDFPIVCTEDHKFLVYDSEDHCTKWIEARDLTTGTSLLLPIQKRKYSYYKKNKDKAVLSADDINQCYESISLRSKRNCYLKTDINLTPEIMMLFGLWLADGSITITDKSKTVTFTFNKSEYAVYFNSFVRKALDQLGINSYSVKNRDDHTRVDLTIGELSSVAIFKFIFGIHHAEDKFIPAQCVRTIFKDLAGRHIDDEVGKHASRISVCSGTVGELAAGKHRTEERPNIRMHRKAVNRKRQQERHDQRYVDEQDGSYDQGKTERPSPNVILQLLLIDVPLFLDRHFFCNRGAVDDFFRRYSFVIHHSKFPPYNVFCGPLPPKREGSAQIPT